MPVVRDGERIATIYPSATVNRRLRLASSRTDAPGAHIGLLREEGEETTSATMETLGAAGLDYWALGGSPARVIRSQHPFVVKAGTIQGRGLGAEERGEKGATLVTVDGGEVRGIEFVALDQVRFDGITVDVSPFESVLDLATSLREAADVSLSEAEGRILVLMATLTGDGPARQEIRAPGAITAMLHSLRDDAETRRLSVFWADLADLTRASRDLETIRGRGDVSAELLAVADGLREDPQQTQALLQPLVDEGSLPLEEADLAALVSAAEAIALDELEMRTEASL